MSRLTIPPSIDSSPQASCASTGAVATSLGGDAATLAAAGREHGLTTIQAAGLLKMVPAGRFATAEDIASGVAYLASSDASYVIGAELTIDGGLGQI